MTEHTNVAVITAGGPEGTITLQEYKCDGKYVLVDDGFNNYCPRCGEEL